MKIDLTRPKKTQVVLKVTAEADELKLARQNALKRLQPQVKADGFRKGKVPLNIVEKNVDQKTLNTELIDEAVNLLMLKAIEDNKLRMLERPNVEVTKFVPGQELEFTATIDVIAPIKLADYKSIKLKLGKVKVADAEINEVVENIRTRAATKKETDRASKAGDEVVIDFDGVDEKGKEVAGAKGTDYPLSLGSKTFIEGFEENLTGVKKGENKTFELTFPKDYGHKPLASKKVTFKTKIKLVNEIIKPDADDALAAKVGPFKSLDELKVDIKKQLNEQKLAEEQAKLKDELVAKILKDSQVEAPDSFVADQKNHIMEDFKKNLMYRGMTITEYLEQAGKTEEEYIETEVTPQAENRVKVGLVLAEIAEKEGLMVTDEDVSLRIQLLKGQIQDPAAQANLESDESKRDLANRIITEKTLDKLVEYAT